jgi:hypothetical protein
MHSNAADRVSLLLTLLLMLLLPLLLADADGARSKLSQASIAQSALLCRVSSSFALHPS